MTEIAPGVAKWLKYKPLSKKKEKCIYNIMSSHLHIFTQSFCAMLWYWGIMVNCAMATVGLSAKGGLSFPTLPLPRL